MDIPTSLPLSVESSEKTDKIEKSRMWQRFSFARFLGRDEQPPCPAQEHKQEPQLPRPGFGRRLSRKVVPGLPRPGTFRRQNSERREKLQQVQPSLGERRTVSVDRRRALSARPASPPPIDVSKISAPEARDIEDGFSTITRRETWPEAHSLSLDEQQARSPPSPPPPPPNPNFSAEEPTPSEGSGLDDIDEEIRDELEKRWILNLSMHFRDHSPREKFFLTYAETPRRWRRVTISCDYRDAPLDSLERDLQSLQFQRDKSARIYESIRSSLADIHFYDTVTNLKLETRDDRLHVHVTEDTNEIIPYPTVHAVQHLECRHYTESELNFEAHMSGFVYKVRVHENIWIKKEIPGPDSVDEFLYEINALNELIGAKSVIQFQGLVVDESHSVVKGLLIGFAEQGAVVDILYDHRGLLPWPRRESWAKQIVQGLSEIHEAGFVQGDFTLSNIVIDEHDEAKIIDINRRGCPVGWEPPEISKLVESSQRISMYIGVKSDLFQLGMVLWALAEEIDEPERQKRPLSLRNAGPDIPQYYRDLVANCLSPKPRYRSAAKELLQFFPLLSKDPQAPLSLNPRSSTSPDNFLPRSLRHSSCSPPNFDRSSFRHRQFSRGDYSYDSPPGSIDLPFNGPRSYIVSRGRQPATNTSHFSISDRSPGASSGGGHGGAVGSEPQIVSVSPGHREHQWDEIEYHGMPYLVQRDSLHLDDKDLGMSGRGGVSVGVSVGTGRVDSLRRDFAHVDSGLADMELVGVGGHETLIMDEEVKGLDFEDRTPRPRRGLPGFDEGDGDGDGEGGVRLE